MIWPKQRLDVSSQVESGLRRRVGDEEGQLLVDPCRSREAPGRGGDDKTAIARAHPPGLTVTVEDAVGFVVERLRGARRIPGKWMRPADSPALTPRPLAWNARRCHPQMAKTKALAPGSSRSCPPWRRGNALSGGRTPRCASTLRTPRRHSASASIETVPPPPISVPTVTRPARQADAVAVRGSPRLPITTVIGASKASTAATLRRWSAAFSVGSTDRDRGRRRCRPRGMRPPAEKHGP